MMKQQPHDFRTRLNTSVSAAMHQQSELRATLMRLQLEQPPEMELQKKYTEAWRKYSACYAVFVNIDRNYKEDNNIEKAVDLIEECMKIAKDESKTHKDFLVYLIKFRNEIPRQATEASSGLGRQLDSIINGELQLLYMNRRSNTQLTEENRELLEPVEKKKIKDLPFLYNEQEGSEKTTSEIEKEKKCDMYFRIFEGTLYSLTARKDQLTTLLNDCYEILMDETKKPVDLLTCLEALHRRIEPPKQFLWWKSEGSKLANALATLITNFKSELIAEQLDKAVQNEDRRYSQ